MKRILFLLVSAFLVSGCGIPQYIMYPEYTFERSSSYGDANIGTLKLEEKSGDTALSGLLENCDGPSIAFFYVLSSSSNKGDVDGCISLFESNYRVNGFRGIPLSTDHNIVFPFTDNGVSQHLFLLSASGDSNQSTFRAPNYVIRLKDNINALNAHIDGIELDKTQVSDSNPKAQTALKLTFTSSDNSYVFSSDSSAPELTLYRYNGRPFVSKADLDSESSYSNEDYEHITDKVYIHLFAAFSISPNSNSDFNNIFWSSLTYMGSVDLSL